MSRLVLTLLVAVLAGCSSYRIEGRVVRGSSAMMAFVDPDDPQLAQPGVAGARIEVDRDPTVLGRTTVAQGYSDGTGAFVIPISDFGAGWMKEQWGLRVTRDGYGGLDTITSLPSGRSGKHLLIILSPGPSGIDAREDLWGEYERHR